jgi:hypothetical protein
VKRRLQDAGLLGRVAKKEPYLRLANKNKRLRRAKEHRHWTEELCLEGQHDGVASSLLPLRLVWELFGEAGMGVDWSSNEKCH